MKITIINLQKKIPIDPKRIKRAVLKTLSSQEIKKSGEITVCLVDDKKIRELNSRYLGRDTSTDVLAFDTGDIAVSTDTAIRNAGIFKTLPLYELYLYVVHGVLHILGYDDRSIKGKRIMERKAELILNKLKVNRKVYSCGVQVKHFPIPLAKTAKSYRRR